MINFKPKIPAMLGALAVLTAGAAHAELLEYTFKAPDGTQRSLTPNANYANPTGNISFALSAGIDRKVKISVEIHHQLQGQWRDLLGQQLRPELQRRHRQKLMSA